MFVRVRNNHYITLPGAGPENDTETVQVIPSSTRVHPLNSARPKVMGHREPRRTQFKRSATFDITYSEAFDRPTGPNVSRGCGEDEGEGEGEYEEEEKQRVEWRRVGLGVAGEVRARRDAVLDTTAIMFCLPFCLSLSLSLSLCLCV